jgi:transglutaminase-like putative cysteine protease
MDIRAILLSILGSKEDYYKGLYENSVNEIALLKAQEWDDGTKPEWLDESQVPYKPTLEVEGSTIQLDPKDIYMETPTIRAIAKQWRDLPLNQKLENIWKFVIYSLVYQYDKAENWQPPIVTVIKKTGDCEDGTILFVTLCRRAHVPADSVFNACGWYKTGGQQYGHSFPIAKREDGKWYIFETTIDAFPNRYMEFKGSNYDGTWGYANWKFAGKGAEQV